MLVWNTENMLKDYYVIKKKEVHVRENVLQRRKVVKLQTRIGKSIEKLVWIEFSSSQQNLKKMFSKKSLKTIKANDGRKFR